VVRPQRPSRAPLCGTKNDTPDKCTGVDTDAVRFPSARRARGLVRRALGLGSRYPDLASLDANLVHGDHSWAGGWMASPVWRSNMLPWQEHSTASPSIQPCESRHPACVQTQPEIEPLTVRLTRSEKSGEAELQLGPGRGVPRTLTRRERRLSARTGGWCAHPLCDSLRDRQQAQVPGLRDRPRRANADGPAAKDKFKVME
jgi:hypothetical protein